MPQWVQVIDESLLPNLPNLKQAKRLSIAFDQNARVMIGYELLGVVYIYIYDVTTQSYVTVNFPGKDPVLFNDVEVNRFVGDSDIICFYHNGIDSILRMRYQRDDFDTEEVFVPDTAIPSGGIITERVLASEYTWQVLTSDALGEPLGLMPTSDRYPIYVTIPAIEGSMSTQVNLRSIVQIYNPTIPAIEGSMSTAVLLRSIVQIYNSTIPTIEGSMSTQVVLSTIVQTYTTTVPKVNGSIETSVTLTTIADQYATTVPKVNGSMSTAVTLTTV